MPSQREEDSWSTIKSRKSMRFYIKLLNLVIQCNKQLYRLFLLMQTLFCSTVHIMLGTVFTAYFQLKRTCKWCWEKHIISSCPFASIKCIQTHSSIAQCLQTVINQYLYLSNQLINVIPVFLEFFSHFYCFYYSMCHRIRILNIV